MMTINKICLEFRGELDSKFNPPFTDLDTFKVTKDLQKKLANEQIRTTFRVGQLIFDDKSYGQENVKHFWLEYRHGLKTIYIDLTAKKYQFFINEVIPKVIIGKLPRYFKMCENN